MQSSQENLKTIVYAKFGGQTKYIMGNWKIKNRALSWTIYGLETVFSVLFTNTRTGWLHNELEIFNTARGVAECSIENFEFIVLPASACICKQNTN